VATPEAFARDPGAVWRFYAARQAALPGAQPNPAHHVLAAMERRYPEFLLVSQNVDDLHERAGSRQLVKLHGSLLETRCTAHGTVAPLEAPISMDALNRGELPRCRQGGLLRPNIVWFGEWLDPTHLARIEQFLLAAEGEPPGSFLLFSIGTSGMVSGGYGFLELAAELGGRTVEINPEPTPFSKQVELSLREPAGALLGRLWPLVSN
jgi:NAD-dependent deacetylase